MKWKDASELLHEKPGELLIVLGLLGYDSQGTNKLAIGYLPENKSVPVIYCWTGRKSNYKPLRYIRIDDIE